MAELTLTFNTDDIRNVADEEETNWAFSAAMKVYNEAVDRILNPLIPNYNELWLGDINSVNEDGTINEEAPYNMRYDEFQKHAYDAMSYIFGVNANTKRIVKLDPPFLTVGKDGKGKIFAHVEDFVM